MAQLDTLKKKNQISEKAIKQDQEKEKKRPCLEFVIPQPSHIYHVSIFTLLQPPKIFPSSSIPCSLNIQCISSLCGLFGLLVFPHQSKLQEPSHLPPPFTILCTYILFISSLFLSKPSLFNNTYLSFRSSTTLFVFLEIS